ncbi:MAG: DUF364 domain-containing protein [Firmicutes bacterium]|jgi:uncharacterized protein (DUF4213/DUF364 family)|nr:DUF364 domain-containing protein [Bacillota bacterium]
MIIDIYKKKFEDILIDKGIINDEIVIKAKVLSTEEAIGKPKRQDYPIIKGKEKLIQANYKGSKGQAFTDAQVDFRGSLSEILQMDFSDNRNVALLVASINSVLKHLGLISNTIHCKDEEPITCSGKLANFVKEKYGPSKIALIGLQPAMLEALAEDNQVRVSDMDKDNIGKYKHGVMVEDASLKTEEIVQWSDFIIATGSTVANNSIDSFVTDKEVYFFGTTIAGVAYLMGYERFCTESL